MYSKHTDKHDILVTCIQMLCKMQPHGKKKIVVLPIYWILIDSSMALNGLAKLLLFASCDSKIFIAADQYRGKVKFTKLAGWRK